MTSKEFEQLSKYDQIKVIKEHGVFLADKVVSGDRYFLYAINTFYVELIHELSNIHCQGLAIARVFDDAETETDESLNAYLPAKYYV